MGTTDYRPLPGVPWAIMKNFAKHGLECKLFFRHDWDEPFFQFVRSVIESWPVEHDDCGAYIGFLSNPPNLDTADARPRPQFAFLPDSRQQDPAGEGAHRPEASNLDAHDG